MLNSLLGNDLTGVSYSLTSSPPITKILLGDRSTWVMMGVNNLPRVVVT